MRTGTRGLALVMSLACAGLPDQGLGSPSEAPRDGAARVPSFLMLGEPGVKKNPVAFFAPELGGELVIGFVRDGTALVLFRHDGSRWAEWAALAPPDPERPFLYSPEIFHAGGVTYFAVSTKDVDLAEGGNDGAIWIMSVGAVPGRHLYRRIDDGALTGLPARRFEPEPLLGSREVFVYYNAVDSGRTRLRRAHTGIRVTTGGETPSPGPALSACNRLTPVTDPVTGERLHLAGLWAENKANSSSGWAADVSFGRRYLRTDALEVVRFTRDAGGAPLPEPVEMLVARIWDLGELGAGAVSGRSRFITVAVRDDARRTWTLSRVASVPDAEKGFASVRAMKVHTDRLTGREYLFVGAACTGVYKGVFDPGVPGRIRWTGGDEVDVSFGRLHSMCRANGELYGSFDYGGLTVQNQTGGIFRRVDGDEPRWERVYRNYDPRYPTWNQTDRGITAVPAADGSGREVILTGVEWPPEPIIVRIEPHDGNRAVTELDYNQYFTEVFGSPPQILGGSKENPHAGSRPPRSICSSRSSTRGAEATNTS